MPGASVKTIYNCNLQSQQRKQLCITFLYAHAIRGKCHKLKLPPNGRGPALPTIYDCKLWSWQDKVQHQCRIMSWCQGQWYKQFITITCGSCVISWHGKLPLVTISTIPFKIFNIQVLFFYFLNLIRFVNYSCTENRRHACSMAYWLGIYKELT